MSDFAPMSVIIPCYCCQLTIKRAVTSVINQSVLPYEVILIDDASSDETLQVLHELESEHKGWIKLISLPVNAGAASARNAGWDAATQPYIAFLDADDSWHPEKLRIQYEYMKENPHIALTGHLCIEHKKEDVELDVSRCEVQKEITAKSLLFRNAFSTPTVMLKRNIPLRFKADKRYAEDFLLWQKIAFLNLTIVRLECTLAYVHKPFYGAKGLSSQMWRMEKGELDNFLILLKEKDIGFSIYGMSVIFSLIKYIRRIIRSCRQSFDG